MSCECYIVQVFFPHDEFQTFQLSLVVRKFSCTLYFCDNVFLFLQFLEILPFLDFIELFSIPTLLQTFFPFLYFFELCFPYNLLVADMHCPWYSHHMPVELDFSPLKFPLNVSGDCWVFAALEDIRCYMSFLKTRFLFLTIFFYPLVLCIVFGEHFSSKRKYVLLKFPDLEDMHFSLSGIMKQYMKIFTTTTTCSNPTTCFECWFFKA